MSKILSMSQAIAQHVPDGGSIALGLQLEQMIPFAAGHEIIRQKKRDLRLIGPISDILFDQLIGAGCVRDVVAAWAGNVMMGSAYNFRHAAEVENPGTPGEKLKVFNMTNFSIALALQAGALGVPFLPTRTAMGSDVPQGNHFFYQIISPFEPKETLLAVRAIQPDVAILHLQRADKHGNAHCWGNFGVMLEASRAAKKVIVCAEEIVDEAVIASDPNRTVVPGFLVSAVVECPYGAHPSPVQGCYKRDDAFFQQYHAETKTPAAFAAWAQRWIHAVPDREGYARLLGSTRLADLAVKQHAYAAGTDFGY
ncbi:MAG TPA: CoA-transferase [Candidatus Limnocylindrales bacterium]|nr:CoA-transferase [Candidatus Limnocylindrales bacterium]